MLRFPWERQKPDAAAAVTLDRNGIIFRRGDRSMRIDADPGDDEVVIFAETVGRWDDSPGVRVSESEREQILREIERELGNRGLRMKLLPVG